MAAAEMTKALGSVSSTRSEYQDSRYHLVVTLLCIIITNDGLIPLDGSHQTRDCRLSSEDEHESFAVSTALKCNIAKV